MSQVGYVYILTNESFREDWIKIGKSSRPVDVRSKELDNTAVPLPFEIYATMKTVKYNEVEKLVHKTIDRLTDLRIRQNREFFNISPQVALDIFRDIAKAIDDAEITVYDKETPAEDGKTSEDGSVKGKRKPPFKFNMIGAKVGEELTFIPTGTTVKIASNDQVEFEGRLYKLSAFVGTYLPDNQRRESDCYQGPAYFLYKGRKLTDLRRHIEEAQYIQDRINEEM